MKVKRIIFTAPNTAALIDDETPLPAAGEVTVEMRCTALSAGTERASVAGDPNTDATRPASETPVVWPRWGGGYSGSGVIAQVGEGVARVKVGDRVIVRASSNRTYCTVPEDCVYPIPSEKISFEEAAMAYISTFSLSGVRHTRPEAGESAMVMGLGILGMFAVQFLHAHGCVPVIAVDPIASKREDALKLGADYALDPTEADFPQKVKALTDGGANVCVEVTGNGHALDQALDCMARFGRVALLGCTRHADFTIDYYRKVHYPGIQLIGAHTGTRPDNDSRPGFWCYDDEFRAICRMILGGRVDYKKMIHEIHSPAECPEVYARLVSDRSFPCGVIWDWTKI